MYFLIILPERTIKKTISRKHGKVKADSFVGIYKYTRNRRLINLDIDKKHILKSYKNEQEAIDAVERIKDEKEKTLNSSISGYNFEKPAKTDKYPTNAFSPGLLDMGEPAFKDYEDDPTENPDKHENKSIDLERPLPERVINNRLR
jgi:hypothetical protein